MDININLTLHPSPELLDLLKGQQMTSNRPPQERPNNRNSGAGKYKLGASEVRKRNPKIVKDDRNHKKPNPIVAKAICLGLQGKSNKEIREATGLSTGAISNYMLTYLGREGYVNKKAELFKGMRYAKIQRIAEGLD